MNYKYNPESFQPWHDWHESTYDDAKAIAALMGWDIDDIRFSGFWSQGDGASFTGSMVYRKGCAASVRDYAPLDTVLHDIADRWQALQKRCIYQMSGNAARNHGSRYVHECTVNVECENTRESWRTLPSDTDDTATDIARDFMRWIYDALEREYEYQVAWLHAQTWQDAAQAAHDHRADARAALRDYNSMMRSPCAPTLPDSVKRAAKAAIGTALQSYADSCAEFDAMVENFHYYSDDARVSIEQFALRHM